jgi:spoIIIJ-associated protein
MENLEASGKTVEEAIQRALEQLGVDREEVEVSVVKEGKPGIMGFGAEEAVVVVTPLVSVPKNEAVEAAEGILEELLGHIGVDCSIVPQTQAMLAGVSAATIVLNIRGDDLGILIGRRGQTLAALQYIVRLIVGHKTQNWEPVIIDVEGYKQRRYEALQNFARQIAEQVKGKKTQFTMEPMPAYERRIVHLSLADHPDITTESTGLGEARKVVIRPKSAGNT